MNRRPNIDPCFNKHVVLGEMLIKDHGVKQMIISCIESIDDHIKNNLNRESDGPTVAALRYKQSMLKAVI